MQPPRVLFRSSTQTRLPRLARTAAQTSELMPLPTITASYVLMAYSGARMRGGLWVGDRSALTLVSHQHLTVWYRNQVAVAYSLRIRSPSSVSPLAARA